MFCTKHADNNESQAVVSFMLEALFHFHLTKHITNSISVYWILELHKTQHGNTGEPVRYANVQDYLLVLQA